MGGERVQECPKCRQPNPERVQFCTRCHWPLRYTCPACGNVQAHGERCDRCGVDFLKYGMLQLSRLKAEADRERERLQGRQPMLKRLFSLFRYLRGQ